MRKEIEAAALFITKLVNKNLSNSLASSTHSSSASTSSSSSTSSESPPGFDEQTTIGANGDEHHEDKVEQFRQCLMNALYDRFHNHWFPEQPTKGQAYRCIRLNEWDRHDTTLQQACLQCGIDYKDLQLPVELTLWVDPDEVTCRFGENKGSHCLVAKFKDGELRDNNFNIDINDIDIEIFQQQTMADKFRPTSLQGSPDNYASKPHNHQYNHSMVNNHNNHINPNSSYQFHHQNSHHHHHQQQQQQQQHHHHLHQNHHQQQHHHPGKAAIIPSYLNNYLTDNSIYYYF